LSHVVFSFVYEKKIFENDIILIQTLLRKHIDKTRYKGDIMEIQICDICT